LLLPAGLRVEGEEEETATDLIIVEEEDLLAPGIRGYEASLEPGPPNRNAEVFEREGSPVSALYLRSTVLPVREDS